MNKVYKLFNASQTMWLNTAIRTMWPVYNEIIAKMAIEQAKPQIDAALKGVKLTSLPVNIAGTP